MSLAKETAQALAWVALIAMFKKMIGFITQIILAKILVPADFGLLAIGLLVISSMEIFSNLGLGSTLIYRKDDSHYTAANTAFILLPLVAFILFLIAYFSASYVALFFNNEAVKPIIQVLALMFVISSFGTVPSTLIEKELEFKKKILPETVPILGYACTALWLAINGYGIWSLVYGQIVSTVLAVGLIWFVSDWRPTFTFDLNTARVLFSYGKHFMGASIVIFLISNIDNAVVGRVLGMEALGFYTIAYTISNLPATQLTYLVGRVMFPTYSKLQDDRIALKSAYLRTLKYVSILSIPAAFGMFIIAFDFVGVVLGSKWLPAVPALQILCIYGLLRSIAATTGSIFQSIGRAEILFRTSALQLLFMMCLIGPLTTKYGIVGTSLSLVFPMSIITIIQTYFVKSLLNINTKEIIKLLLIPLFNSILMMFWFDFANNFSFHILNETPIVKLIFLVLSCVLIYVGSVFILPKIMISKRTNSDNR